MNLTISVDGETLRQARIRAAEQGTSVNAVLRRELERFADVQDPAAGFLELANRSRASSEGRSWTREELHLERFSE